MGTENYTHRQRRFCLSVQALLFLCATLAGNKRIAKSTAADLVITLRQMTGVMDTSRFVNLPLNVSTCIM